MKILICDPIDETGIAYLKKQGYEVLYEPEITPKQIVDVGKDAAALIVRSRTKVTKEILTQCKHLKVIGRAGTGVDTIDTTAAQERNIAVVNAPATNSNAVAEHTIGLILSLLREIPRTDALTRKGSWPKKMLMGTELKGKVLGIVGLGNIGSRVSTIAEAFGCRVLTHDYDDTQDNLTTLLATSDIITLHVPLTEETRHLINKESIELMKDGAYLVNTSRAEVIHEKDLVQALESGKLAGVGLDVYWQEPLDSANKLNKFTQTVLTSHIAGQTHEANRAATMSVAEDVVSVLRDESPRHRIV